MLSSLLRGKRRPERRPLLSRGGAAREDTTSTSEGSDLFNEERNNSDDNDAPLLPIFSAAHLDKIPIYNLQHNIRILIVQKCETTLSWDQLRSPQISQFLVKPIQQQIKGSQFSRGILYALLSNCLQFQKDAQLNPAIVGISRTRAVLCELLAMRFLKEPDTRELIDGLFYDFDPMQGLPSSRTGQMTPMNRTPRAPARISCVEIAIKAQAKRFLAHPVVVAQLEAIWAGNIVFHAAADTFHRRPLRTRDETAAYGSTDPQSASHAATALKDQSSSSQAVSVAPSIRRSVSLYDPSEASIFKLSRLRVPRYRQLFSMISYATMLGLFLAVLIDRSLDITALEILFWFWGAGYMLDEVVGFTEQGFGLYIMSFWNVFDIGILLLFVIYYVLRLYGILMPDVRKRRMANMAYDVLASTAVLLFPRLFSFLDHYRYFSQLLIAFRMMAVDLIAILLLIVISCSGFFVAFTMSFSDKETNPSDAAYALFQLIMGFTPAAWDKWKEYNFLGKALMAVFLVICHFLIVTILITVLTNSFMAIVRNANEEHQFLFAVNTISLVKSDALFSYVAPTNILAWLLAPLRYVMPFSRFVKLNRTIIKITHLPVLFLIFAYERIILSRHVYEPTDLIEQRGRASGRIPAFSIRGPDDLFSPAGRLREPSVTTLHKDRALEEVFRRPFRETRDVGPGRKESILERNKSSNVVQDWMRGVGQEGGASSPLEQPRSVVDRLENRRQTLRRYKTSQVALPRRREWLTAPKPASDPADDVLITLPPSRRDERQDYGFPSMSSEHLPQQTDADGDDELATNDEDERQTYERSFLETDNGTDLESKRFRQVSEDREGNNIASAGRYPSLESQSRFLSSPTQEFTERPVTQQRIPPRHQTHARNSSSGTILFSPLHPSVESRLQEESGTQRPPSPAKRPKQSPTKPTGPQVSSASGTATPNRLSKRSDKLTAVPRPKAINILRNQPYPASNLAQFLALSRRKPSLNAMALDLASELGDNRSVPDANIIGALPASLGTQLEMAAWQKSRQRQRPSSDDDEEDRGMRGETATKVNRMMIERMSHLEAGFREVLREVKRVSRAGSVDDENSATSQKGRKKGKKKLASLREREKASSSSQQKMHGNAAPEDKDTSGSADEAWVDEHDGKLATRSSV